MPTILFPAIEADVLLQMTSYTGMMVILTLGHPVFTDVTFKGRY